MARPAPKVELSARQFFDGLDAVPGVQEDLLPGVEYV